RHRDLALVDLSALPGSGSAGNRRERELQRLVRVASARAFDLANGPLFRTLLFRLAPEEHYLLATMHPPGADAWSGAVLVQELGALYQSFETGMAADLPALPVQYADFAVWQRSWLTGDALAAELDWWRERLAGAPPRIELPADRPRAAAGWRLG